VEPIKSRRDAAVKLGADVVIDPMSQDVTEDILKHTSGLGGCVTIVATSVASVISMAFKAARRNSQVLLFAGFPEGATFDVDPNVIHYRQIHVLGSSGSTISQRKRALHLLAMKRIQVGPLISEIVPLDRIVDGFKLVSDQSKLKILVQVSQGGG
jgi:L-iditol 2-dehydrogenase